MNTLIRLGRLRAVLASRSSNPYLRGRAAQLAGGALIADGLVGLENPLDGQKTRGGILSGIPFILVGVLFSWLLGGMITSVEPYPDGHIVQGTVVAVERSTSTDSKGRTSTSCFARVQVVVGNESSTVTTGYGSSSQCDMEGSTVDVSVRGSDSASGRVLIPGDHTLFSVLRYGVWAVIALGVWVFLTRLASIIVGVVLFLRGRRLVSAHPAVPVDELMQDLREAWSGSALPMTPGSGTTAAPGPAAPTGVLGGTLLGGLGGTLAGRLGGREQAPSTPSTQPSAPPAGWMLDPQGSGRHRWWDGQGWTDHYR